MDDVVKRIMMILEDKNMSYNSLSAKIGVPVTTFSNWKNRSGRPNHETLLKISKELQVPLTYLETGIEPTFNLDLQVREIIQRIAVLPEEKQRDALKSMFAILSVYEQ